LFPLPLFDAPSGETRQNFWMKLIPHKLEVRQAAKAFRRCT